MDSLPNFLRYGVPCARRGSTKIIQQILNPFFSSATSHSYQHCSPFSTPKRRSTLYLACTACWPFILGTANCIALCAYFSNRSCKLTKKGKNGAESFVYNADHGFFFQQVTVVSNRLKQETTGAATTITIQDGSFCIQVYHLECCFCSRDCCYSNSEPPFNHPFYKDQEPSHSQYVLGYKLNRGGHVGWRTFWSF